MSSEDKSVEPSDLGPPPLSAVLAAAPVGSPVSNDKRPRGRPRKDGTTPLQKKKKSRSRGKTVIEDDDSMDGLEATENAMETEVKDDSLEEDTLTEMETNEQSSLLQRSISEDSASSITSINLDTKTSNEQLCALCYCGERSSLGQGELKRFNPTPDFTVLKKSPSQAKQDSTDSPEDGNDNNHKQCSTSRRRQQKSPCHTAAPPSTCINVTVASEEQTSRYWDELSQVGLPDDIDVQALFEPSGHCWVHHCCAEWSSGVCQANGPVLVNVDKAVLSGITEHCAYCKHLGATIKCSEVKCNQLYHYPCAAGAGTFQDIKTLTLLCPEHIDQAPERSKEEANCAVCDSPGELLDQLFCTSCGQHYHGACLDIVVTPLKRAGWQCPECKICQTCRHPGDDSKMLVCDICDKGYHTFCLQPAMESIPTNGWRCKNCRVCVDCGARTSTHWHHNCSLCATCYQQQDHSLPCPLCDKTCYQDSQKDMLHCQMCKRWIHIECDRSLENTEDISLKECYICTLCKETEAAMENIQSCDNSKTVGSVQETAIGVTEINGTIKEKLPQGESVHQPDYGINHVGDQTVVANGNDLAAVHTTELVEPDFAKEALVSEKVLEQLDCPTAVTEIQEMEVNENKPETLLQPQLDEETQNFKDLVAGSVLVKEELQLCENKTELMEVSVPEVSNNELIQATTLIKELPEILLRDKVAQKSEENISQACLDSSVSEAAKAPSESASEMSSTVENKTVKMFAETGNNYTQSNKTSVSSSFVTVSVGVSPVTNVSCASAAGTFSGIPASTFVPMVPKIGMGKPAITKRKFSPGRPRMRQGMWATNTMSSPTWSTDSYEFRESMVKTKQPQSTIWNIKVGRGAGFPGKKRPRGTGHPGRGVRGRSKLKNGIGATITPGAGAMEMMVNKDEDENSMHNTVVLFSTSDKFTLKQDMCVVCGSFGKGSEGRLLVCSQCGQCYHPYCVSIKITKVVLSKGWRCLECTVCESCGKASDPGRLLLCDDCDISYHTYCLDPPLQTVPKGGWKCRWCVSCMQCGATSPGFKCEWQNNYTQCAPCASLAVCPVCNKNYREEELIIQCRQCDRWIHAICQNLNTEDEVETAADNGYDCFTCRQYAMATPVTTSEGTELSLVTPQFIVKTKEPEPTRTYTQDGVCLTEMGMSQLQSLSIAPPRRKRPKPKLKLKIINQNSVAVLQTPPDPQSEQSRDMDGDMDESRAADLMDCDAKSDTLTSPEREAADDDCKGAEGTDNLKKRKRKPYRPGIGGFMVRQRSRTGQNKTKRSLSRKNSTGSVSEMMAGKEDGWVDQLPEVPGDEVAAAPEIVEKMKKRYRKKKNKLEEIFPAYLQEAFFGKHLLLASQQSKLSLDALSDEESSQLPNRVPNANVNFLDPSSDPLLSSATTQVATKQQGGQGNGDDPLADLSEVLTTEDDILGILSDELGKTGDESGLDLCTFQVENSPSPFAGLDIGPISEDPSTVSQSSGGQGSRPLTEEQLDRILSPDLEKIVSDGTILSKLYKIPELEGKEVEDLFTAVLSPSANQAPPPPRPLPPLPPPPPPDHGDGAFTRMPAMNGVVGPHLQQQTSLAPGGGRCLTSTYSSIPQSPFTDSSRDKNHTFSQVVTEPPNPWVPSAPAVEAEGDTLNYTQRSTLKWEKEEALGEMATVAPVLYTNTNFPNLKEDFPDWATRAKQIAKLWRKASSQERAPYVQKARDNRAALRINKVQMTSESLRRQQQECIDSVSRPDIDLPFKDQMKQKESEHEQEWKLRQQMRQKSKQQAKIEATQKLEQVKHEQQQQQQQFGSQQSTGEDSNSPKAGEQDSGHLSPLHLPKEGFTRPRVPGTSVSTPSDDVFLRPQAPPPTPTRIPLQDPFAQSQTSQPQSPQFSPAANASRPSSPWDPYAKMRLRLRELILRQQQQKNAVRQEKGLQEQAMTSAATPLRHWPQEDLKRQNELFGRPPPPYPGIVRLPRVPQAGQRFSGLFSNEPRGRFITDGQFNRPQFSGDVARMVMRPQGPRNSFAGTGQRPFANQELFLGQRQMQAHVPGLPQQLRRSLSVDFTRSLNNPQMNNGVIIPQHFPPRGMQMQQHNILGQPFIELRHRVPENRPRLPFASLVPSTSGLDPVSQQQRPGGITVPVQGAFSPSQGPKPLDSVSNQQQGMRNQMENCNNLDQLNEHQMHINHPAMPLSRSLSNPHAGDTFSSTVSLSARASTQGDGMVEKLDSDEPSVKDLDVKDLDGVRDLEVKDLDDEDLENLNLDQVDGKGDPDLDNLDNIETNDPHLDDLLKSGEFDLIAYTDPELDLGDKKDMFNEELELNDPIDDKLDEQSKTEEETKCDQVAKAGEPSDHCPEKEEKPSEGSIERSPKDSKNSVKSETGTNDGNHDAPYSAGTAETETIDTVTDSAPTSNSCIGGELEMPKEEERVDCNQEIKGASPGFSDSQSSTQTSISIGSNSCNLTGSTPVLSSLLTEKTTNSGLASLGSPTQILPSPQSHPNIGISQSPNTAISPGQMPENAINQNLQIGQRLNRSFSQGPSANQTFFQVQPPNQNYTAGQQPSQNVIITNQPGPSNLSNTQQIMLPQTMGLQAQRERPLLLEEQPLLLQDLLEQERQEQQQQRQMQAMIRHRSTDSFFPNIDFDAITDPIMKAKMVALKGINRVMAQSNLGMPPIVMNRFPFVGQPMSSTQSGDSGQNPIHQGVSPDGNLPPQMSRPNPPSFGPGFMNDAQKKQYEEWLQETQQLLQMQQKYLEEQIGAHRKSKKALSAKQRTAKKAGREFPEEDAEQLKHVTEQQSMVQKQLEQIRKQQKEHSELMEEYRIKQQQQCPMASSTMMPTGSAQPPSVQGGAPSSVTQQSFSVMPKQQPQQQIQMPVPAQPSATRMANAPQWQSCNPNAAVPTHIPMGTPRMQHPAPPQLPMTSTPSTEATTVTANQQSNVPPRVEFDDNNPFSESFQERERRERLREQQERQRIQLMKEVERHRAMQKRMEMEQQQGMADLNTPTLSQMPYFTSDLPCDFMQSQRPQQVQQMGLVPPQQQNLLPQFMNSPSQTSFMQCNDRRPVGAPFGPEGHAIPGGCPPIHPMNQVPSGLGFPQNQPRPPFEPCMPAGSQGNNEGAQFAPDSGMQLPGNYPGPGQSLIQLYSNIIPEEKGKKRRNRKKKKDDDSDSVKTPSTPHSDITAPTTPSVSDPAANPPGNISGDFVFNQGEHESEEINQLVNNSNEHQPPSELERQLSSSVSAPHRLMVQQAGLPSETDHSLSNEGARTNTVKVEQTESTHCHDNSQPKVETQNSVKVEGKVSLQQPAVSTHNPTAGANVSGSKQESGNELLKHLLKNKNPPLPPHQRAEEKSEDESCIESNLVKKPSPFEGQSPPGGFNFDAKVSQLQKKDSEEEKKRPRNKRSQKTAEKTVSRYKKRKKDEEDRHAIYPNTDMLMNQLKQQLTLLPLLEPTISVNFAYFPPYGSGQLNGDNLLTGSFGSAVLDSVPDYYSQLIYKQSNLSNPPTPPASLPPTPPPVARQKLVNGFATTEEIAGKPGVIGHHDVSKGLGPKQYQLPFRPEDDLLARALAHGPKTVDVPASLPTPPHNNHEELRGQEHCGDDERDSPDSFVASSSPESVVGMEVSRYPDLSLVKEEPPDPAPSPVIPMLPSSTGKGSEARRSEVKMEPTFGSMGSTMFFGNQFAQSQNGPKIGFVSVALTLTPTAAEDINGVVARVADLLRIKVPNSYEVSSAPEPPSMPLINAYKFNQALESRPSLMAQGSHPGFAGPIKIMRPVGPTSLPYMIPASGTVALKADNRAVMNSSTSSKPQWCRHCDVVVLGNGVRKTVTDLPYNKQDSRDGTSKTEADIVFCSNNCFVQYAMATQAKTPESKQQEVASVVVEQPAKDVTRNTFHHYNNNTSSLDVHRLPRIQENAVSPTTPTIYFPPANLQVLKQEPKPEDLKVTVKLKPRPRSLQGDLDDNRPAVKRWKGMKWKKWRVQIVIPKAHLKLASEEEIDELLKKLGTSLKPEPMPRDYRRCCLCHEEGDGTTNGAARLLNLDLDLWVHLNCALWSTEVYETQAGALINVEMALRRGLSMKCVFCHKMGATGTCHRIRCTNIYHFTCASKAQCMFFKDKTMLCSIHKPKGPHEQELTYFAVFRRVYVQRDEVKQVASIVQRGERNHTFRVGGLIFHAIGQLLPQQMQSFHSSIALYPVGYEASRFYWSTRYSNKRSRYLCSIEEKDNVPEFVVRVIEQGHEDLVLTGSSPKGVWQKLLEPIARLRKEADMLKLFPDYLKGDDLFGLTVSAVTRIAESLPGVENCENYTFRYGRNPLMELPLAINPSGSARSEPKMSTHVKRFVLRPHTLNSTSTSKSFQSTVTGELNAPYSKQFVHSKSSQYRKMKTEWKINVYLARSRIQGLGLYAARDIEKHTMVIEYIGTIIRNEVANRREKLYESQNRGVYMFRIDSDHVIDATLTGGPARYINHSCAPNCVAEVVTFEKGHKIIISSNRRIQKGEELSYDYKFDFEDDQHKIPCHCGAVNCRKWMN
ncbi:histone-lysine N-methyltransferase 2C isoform X6 [Carcharodon carcharias]|uniref:histone-lysine N-methyltransferase 2C isoform X6 n=1 Tax=Carcharodon carcharias TaxID=13397 RepID=UPI001B7E6B27|nr:histone-lysine N-methyltransferase 2C isoform X6 [Carcharodon carcharias]